MTKDQFIVKALGECWHEWKDQDDSRFPIRLKYQFIPQVCIKCGLKGSGEMPPNLDTPEGFFWLWERFQKHERWVEFWDEQMRGYLFKSSNVPSIIYFEHLINPLRFRDITAEFFGWKD